MFYCICNITRGNNDFPSVTPLGMKSQLQFCESVKINDALKGE